MRKLLYILMASIPFLEFSQNCNYVWGDNLSISTNSVQIEVDAFGNTILITRFSGNIDVDPGPNVVNLASSGEGDILLAKYDVNGNYLWAKSFGSTGDEIAGALAIDASGNILITGAYMYTVDFNPGPGVNTLPFFFDRDIFIAKYDPNGNYIWAKSINSFNYECGNCIQIDKNGNILLAGEFGGSVDFDPGPGILTLSSNGNMDIFFAKYSSSGDLIWAKNIGGQFNSDIVNCARLDNLGNIYLTGTFIGNADFDTGPSTAPISTYDNTWGDVFIAKYSTNGDFIWAKNITNSHEWEGGLELQIGSDHSVYCTGRFMVADFDPGPGQALEIANQGYDYNIYLAKYDSLGNYLWVKNIGGLQDDEGESLQLTSNDNIYLTGFYGGKTDFDPGQDSAIIYGSYYSRQIFVASYDNTGLFQWVKTLKDTMGAGSSACLRINANEDMILGGTFFNSIDMDPNSGIANASCTGSHCSFIAKYSKFPVGLNELLSDKNALKIFPNPCDGKFLINTGAHELQLLSVYDIGGKLVYKKEIKDKEILDVSNLEGGIYSLNVANATKKLVIIK